MKKDPRMRLGYEIEDDEEETGSEPWALGDLELEPLDFAKDDVGEADGWLDEQLGRVQAGGSSSDAPIEQLEAPASQSISSSALEGDGGAVVLRRPASMRSPRRRRADPEAVSDLPVPTVPGY